MNALMYHDVVEPGADNASGFPGRDAGLYKITPHPFAEPLDALVELLPAPPDPPDPPDRPDPLGPVLTFDDGGASAVQAAELLEARGFVGHFLITTNYIGT